MFLLIYYTLPFQIRMWPFWFKKLSISNTENESINTIKWSVNSNKYQRNKSREFSDKSFLAAKILATFLCINFTHEIIGKSRSRFMCSSKFIALHPKNPHKSLRLFMISFQPFGPINNSPYFIYQPSRWRKGCLS